MDNKRITKELQFYIEDDFIIDIYGAGGGATKEEIFLKLEEKENLIRKQYPEYEKITFKFEYEYERYDSVNIKTIIFGHRTETDEEVELRKTKEEAHKKACAIAASEKRHLEELKEKALFEKLKKKYS